MNINIVKKLSVVLNSNEEISARQAWEILSLEKSILIDVRTEEECKSTGIVDIENVVNIPIQSRDMSINSLFTQSVHELVNCKDTKLLFICRSGIRSRIAAQMMHELGYKNSYNIYDGFEGELNDSNLRSCINGWIFEKLPWRKL